MIFIDKVTKKFFKKKHPELTVVKEQTSEIRPVVIEQNGRVLKYDKDISEIVWLIELTVNRTHDMAVEYVSKKGRDCYEKC